MDVTYVRYQDDIIILCKTKRQLNRCRRKMMEVLHERRLGLSRKKSRIGCIEKGFHFLGIDYPGTQTQDKSKVAHAMNDTVMSHASDPILTVNGGGVGIIEQSQHALLRIVPHARTFRRAREQVKAIVMNGFSIQEIRGYLWKWLLWWQKTSEAWQLEELLNWFINVCWELPTAAIAAGLLPRATLLNSDSSGDCLDVA